MVQTTDTESVDIDAAETFLKAARAAHEAGDAAMFIAARKLVTVALGLSDGRNARLETQHLKDVRIA